MFLCDNLNTLTFQRREIERRVQNEAITKNGVFPLTTLFSGKFCFGIRASYKELI